MGASTGAIGTARAQNHLRQILVYLNMFPINQPEVLISNTMDRFDQEENLTHAPTRERISGFLQDRVDWVQRIGPNETGPGFSSDEQALQVGLEQKAREFVEKGNEPYVPYRQALAVCRKSWNALRRILQKPA